MTQQGNQPIFILADNVQRTVGRDAQRNNIAAAKAVAETVRTTLGPKGMDKMLVDSLGDIVITNDGVTILEEMQIEHPAAKMLVEVAKTQENEVGDGTTTVVVLAGELLKNAERLLDLELHPTVIARGYRMASEKAQEVLNKIAENVSEKDTDILRKIAQTAMTGKGAESSKEKLSEIIIKAIKQIIEHVYGKIVMDMDAIKIEKKVGGGVEDSELISGILIDKERIHSAMPKMIKGAKIALLDLALEIKSTETDAKIQISDPMQLQAFLDQEEKMLKAMADKVIKSGANVIITQKGIDDLIAHFLAKNGIYAARRAKKSDMDNLARATGARVVSNLSDLTSSDLGYAGVVEEQKIGDEAMTYVRECKNPKAVTILIRGGSSHVIDEIERAVKDALGDLSASLKIGKVVAGGGAAEMEVVKALRSYANKMSGREQLAVMAFADSFEIIPRTLAENAGLDPIDMLTELKVQHDKGVKWAGIDVFKGKVTDCWKMGVIEPLKIKTQATKSASEVAELILRIDDVIAASNLSRGGPGGMPPGMPGGMPDMM